MKNNNLRVNRDVIILIQKGLLNTKINDFLVAVKNRWSQNTMTP